MTAGFQAGAGAGVLPLRLALRTPTLPPATTTNTLIVGVDKLVIIEPATPHGDEQQRLDQVLDRFEAEGRTVVGIALTHHHRDHIGYAEVLRRRRDVPIHAHRETAARLPFVVDELLDDGDRIELGGGRTLDAVHTPGHAPGHLVFVDSHTGIAHAGDMVAGEGTILIDPDDGGDMADYLASLAKLRGLGVTRLVPAHGPNIDEVESTIDALIEHRLQRERKLVASLAAGAQSLHRLLERVYDDKPPSVWPLALRSLRAHLDKLVGEGRVEMDGDYACLVRA